MTRSLRLHGVVYECTLVYAQDERLDPLGELIYEALGHERDIERLSVSFGLSLNLVDSILVDLVRRGFAVLDIDRNQLLRVDNPSARPNYLEGRAERIWHDLYTGGLVLERRVRPFFHPGRNRQELIIQPPPDVADFMRISNAQIISQLVRREPMLEWQEGRRWRLDRITERRRIEGRSLWIDINEQDFFGEMLDLIDAEDIPAWMARSWTSALSRKGEGAAPSILPRPPRRDERPPAREDVVDLLGATSVEESLRRWTRALTRILDLAPPPGGLAELGELQREEALLTRTIDSRMKVEIGAASALAGLDNAQRSALVVLDEWSDAAVEHIATALKSFGERSRFVDLGVLVPGGRTRLVPALRARDVREDTLATRLTVDELRDGVRCSCVIIDEREVYLARAADLAVPGGWLRLEAPPGDDLALAKSFRAAIENRCQSEDFAAWLRQRSIERARCHDDDDIALERPFSVTRRLRDLVLDTEIDVDGGSLRSVRKEDVEAIDTATGDACDAIRRQMEHDAVVAYRDLGPTDRVDALSDLLRRAAIDGGAGRIVLGVAGPGPLLLSPAFLEWVRAIGANDCRIEVAAPAETVASVTDALTAALPPELRRLVAARAVGRIGLSFIALRDWVCVSTLDWLDADVDTPCWTVLIEQRGLRDRLLAAGVP